MKETKPLLTISLLISKRMDTIPRCLDSLRTIMEAIPCELILTDTSEDEKIHALLLEYTDNVIEFEWCNDFAKARNLGLEKANGEWFMFLDDDEWFADASALIDFFKSGEYQKFNYASYKVRNFKDAQHVYYDDCWLARLFCIEDNSRFIRKIHEQFSPMHGDEKFISAMVYHSGYIYETVEDRKKHFERNKKLLLDMIKEEPDNIYWWLQLTQEYSYADEQEKLIHYSNECLQKLSNVDAPYVNNQRGAFYTGLVSGYIRQKQYKESVTYAKEALADRRTGKVLKAMMQLRIAEAYLFLNRIEDAKAAICEYLEIARRIDLNKPEIKKQLEVFLVGEAFNKNSYEIAYAILICCGLYQGEVFALKEHYEKLGWSNPVVYTLGRIEEFMVSAMCNLPYEPIFTQIIIDVFNRENLRAAFRKEILLHKDDVKPGFLQVVYSLAESMQKIMDGPKDSLLDFYQHLRLYIQCVGNWFDFIEAEGMMEYIEKESPSYLQAAVEISEYLELEAANTIVALGKLKNAVGILPEFAKGIGVYVERYNELQDERISQQSNEMETLRSHVISQVKMLIESGQKESALQILGQLKVMFPGDVEIERLGKSFID